MIEPLALKTVRLPLVRIGEYCVKNVAFVPSTTPDSGSRDTFLCGSKEEYRAKSVIPFVVRSYTLLVLSSQTFSFRYVFPFFVVDEL